MMNVVVASYNMSFMSDMGKQLEYASETAWLKRNNSGDGRYYWKNTFELLKKFTSDDQIAGTRVIGLQEMNKTESDETGSAAINSWLSALNIDRKTTNYIQICEEIVVSDSQKPALSVIFDTEIFGGIKSKQIIDNEDQKGRPLLMVITDKDYVFINLHGAQNPKLIGYDSEKTDDFNTYIKSQTDKMFKKAEGLVTPGFNPKGIFVMCDLNDRFDAVSEITFLGKKLKYGGTSPYSCCANWDSACATDNFKSFDNGSGICKAPDDAVVDGKKRKLDDSNATISNYRYKGDKVFGETPQGDITIYDIDNRKSKTTTESDHELIYGIYELPTLGGGGRRGTRRSKNRKSRVIRRKRTRGQKRKI